MAGSIARRPHPLGSPIMIPDKTLEEMRAAAEDYRDNAIADAEADQNPQLAVNSVGEFDVESILAIITELQQRRWQPIETAPKDVAILAGHEKFVFTVWWDETAMGWVDGNTSGYSEELTTYEVSHWMPLPTPPSLTQETSNA